MALRGSWVWCRTWIRAESTIQMENCKKVPQRLECSLPMVLVCFLSSSPLLYLTLSLLHLAGIPHWGSAWLCFPLEFPLSWDPGLHNGAVCPSRFTSLLQAVFHPYPLSLWYCFLSTCDSQRFSTNICYFSQLPC